MKNDDDATPGVPDRRRNGRRRGRAAYGWIPSAGQRRRRARGRRFILRSFESGLQILHKNAPDRILWETVANGTFITAEGAVANIKDFGTPMGFFSITDLVSASYENPTIDKIEIAGCDGDGVWKANARRRQRSI